MNTENEVLSYFQGIQKTKDRVKRGCRRTSDDMKIAVSLHPDLQNLSRKEKAAINEIIDAYLRL